MEGSTLGSFVGIVFNDQSSSTTQKITSQGGFGSKSQAPHSTQGAAAADRTVPSGGGTS